MTAIEARVEWLTVAGNSETWSSLGLTVSADGLIPFFGTGLKIVEPSNPGDAGIVGWALSGIDPVPLIAGLPVDIVAAQPPSFAAHELGALELDHVVITTSNLEAVSDAVAAATGCELKRTRQIGAITQGFHRIGRGGLIVEIVQHVDDDREDAVFWGVVVTVEDLDAACALLGPDRVSEPKDAVQSGRRIATIRSDVGLGTAVALMTPDTR